MRSLNHYLLVKLLTICWREQLKSLRKSVPHISKSLIVSQLLHIGLDAYLLNCLSCLSSWRDPLDWGFLDLWCLYELCRSDSTQDRWKLGILGWLCKGIITNTLLLWFFCQASLLTLLLIRSMLGSIIFMWLLLDYASLYSFYTMLFNSHVNLYVLLKIRSWAIFECFLVVKILSWWLVLWLNPLIIWYVELILSLLG